MADIPVPGWDSLSKTERDQITKAFKEAGSLKSGDKLVNDPNKKPPTDRIAPDWDPIGDICRAACDTAAGIAVAWCVANTAGAGLVVCLAAAEAARKKCRKAC